VLKITVRVRVRGNGRNLIINRGVSCFRCTRVFINKLYVSTRLSFPISGKDNDLLFRKGIMFRACKFLASLASLLDADLEIKISREERFPRFSFIFRIRLYIFLSFYYIFIIFLLFFPFFAISDTFDESVARVSLSKIFILA